MSLPRRYRAYLSASRTQHVALVSELWWSFPPWLRVAVMWRERGLRQAWVQVTEEVLIHHEKEIVMGMFNRKTPTFDELADAWDAAGKLDPASAATVRAALARESERAVDQICDEVQEQHGRR